MNSGILAALVLLAVAVYTANACEKDYCDKKVTTIDESCGCPCHFMKCHANCEQPTILKVEVSCWRSCVRYCAYSAKCRGVVYAGRFCHLKGKGCRHCANGKAKLINRGQKYYQYYTKVGDCRSREYKCISGGGDCRSAEICKDHIDIPAGICPGEKKCCKLKPCQEVGGECNAKECGKDYLSIAGACKENEVCCKPKPCTDLGGTCAADKCGDDSVKRIGACKEGEVCCKLKPCADLGGKCAADQCNAESLERTGKCGDGEKCCKPKPCTDLGGKCAANECDAQSVVRYGSCENGGKCCEPKPCADLGGKCAANECDENSVVRIGKCGTGEKCCEPKPCADLGGKCNANQCDADSVVRIGKCGDGEKCCEPKPCADLGGRCAANECAEDSVVRIGKCGTGEKCCKYKPCAELGGKCAAGQCNAESLERTGKCGDGEKCCKPKPCTDLGGKCAANDCDAQSVVRYGSCENGGKCCEPKPCGDLGGRCAANECAEDSVVRIGKCGTGEKCCKYKPCAELGGTCAADQCDAESEERTGECADGGKCCKPKPCATLGGSCMADECNKESLPRKGSCPKGEVCCKPKPCGDFGGKCTANQCDAESVERYGECPDNEKCCKPKPCATLGGKCAANECDKFTVERTGDCGSGEVCCKPKPCAENGGKCFANECGKGGVSLTGKCGTDEACCKCDEGYRFWLTDGKPSCAMPTGQCLCSASGDPHYRACDNLLYHFQGVCWYTLSETTAKLGVPKCAYKILVQNKALRQGKPVAYTTDAKVTIGGVTLEMSYDTASIKIDGNEETIGDEGKVIEKNDVKLEISKARNNGHFVTVASCDFAALFERHTFRLRIGKTYWGEGAIAGICGNSIIAAEGATPRNLNDYKAGADKADCKDYTETLKCDHEDVLKPGNRCGVLIDPKGPFKDCIAKNPNKAKGYFTNCVYDACANLKVDKCEADCKKEICEAVNAMRIACKQNFDIHVEPWEECAADCFKVQDGFCSAKKCTGQFKAIGNNGRNNMGGFGCAASEYCCACKEKGSKGSFPVWAQAKRRYECKTISDSDCKNKIQGFCVNTNGCGNPTKGFDKGKQGCPGNTICCVCDPKLNPGMKWWAAGGGLRGGWCDVDGSECKSDDGTAGECVKQQNGCKTGFDAVQDPSGKICPKHFSYCCKKAAAPAT